jgi:hypothetical protein
VDIADPLPTTEGSAQKAAASKATPAVETPGKEKASSTSGSGTGSGQKLIGGVLGSLVIVLGMWFYSGRQSGSTSRRKGAAVSGDWLDRDRDNGDRDRAHSNRDNDRDRDNDDFTQLGPADSGFGDGDGFGDGGDDHASDTSDEFDINDIEEEAEHQPAVNSNADLLDMGMDMA